jgi:hypothetical protein
MFLSIAKIKNPIIFIAPSYSGVRTERKRIYFLNDKSKKMMMMVMMKKEMMVIVVSLY